MAGEKPREIALRILQGHCKGSLSLDELLDRELADTPLSPADRALIYQLIYGIIRWQATLDHLIGLRVQRMGRGSVVQILLRMGLYQMFWLERIPDHAVVFEVVELAKRHGAKAKAALVNAVLRGYARRREPTRRYLEDLKNSDPALGFSHPRWLVDRWRRRWGDAKARQLLEWNNDPAPVYARLNALAIDARSLTGQWAREGVSFEERRFDWIAPGSVFEIRAKQPLAALGSFQLGGYYLQDPSTLLAVRQMDPRPGETLLDLCAAPGGKTFFAAQGMGDQGRLIAMDNQPERLERLRQNAARLKIKCVEPVLATEIDVPGVPRQFDGILVDAPCSNTGVMRRRVDLRWRLTPRNLQRMPGLQAALLEQVAGRVKPGGRLVYSTCSLEPEENQAVAREFIERHGEYRWEAERQLLPFEDGVDGAYVARFRRYS